MNDAVHVPLGTVPKASHLFAVEGHLRVLTIGNFNISLRDMLNDTEFGRLQWTAAGDVQGLNPQGGAIDYDFMGQGSGIKVNVVGIGTGALDCTLIFWLRVTI
jgi:hypothetical protein